MCVCVFSLIGLSELINDNLTESKRTINLLQRMNIYQEVFLSVLYRVLPIQVSYHCYHASDCPLSPQPWPPCLVQLYLEPVYFYIYTVFSLQAVYVIALYLTAWLLSGSWLAGALAGLWYILNRWVIHLYWILQPPYVVVPLKMHVFSIRTGIPT